MEPNSNHQLLTGHLSIGEQIQNVIRNYKKDSANRKIKPAYYREHLLTLESLWDKFNSGDNQISNFLKAVTLEHDYFNNEFFIIIKQLVKDYKTEFNNRRCSMVSSSSIFLQLRQKSWLLRPSLSA